MRWLFLALPIALVACGGGKDSPTQPPPVTNRVASLTRADTSVLQFTGKKVAIRTLFIAKDAAGAVIPNANIHCTTPTGFTVTGDSLVAPTSELRGRVRCSATTMTYLLTSSAGPQRTDPLPDPADSLTVTAGIDLRASAWHAQWSCGSPTVGVVGYGIVDSVQFNGPVSRFDYPSDASYMRNFDGVAQVVWRGERAVWKNDAVLGRDTIEYTWATVWRQSPDTLFTYSPTWSGGAYPMVLNQASPRRYVGRSWCPSNDGEFPYQTPTILQEVL